MPSSHLSLAFFVVSLLAQVVSGDLISDLNSHGFRVIVKGDSAYANDSAPFNQRFTFAPAAITYPNNAQDVSKILKVAQQYDQKVAARSGGHSYIANGLGGQNGAVVVDMSNFNTISIDSTTNIATIGAGNRLGPVALGLYAKGRAMPHGTCPYVGIGGHSGYGGFGYTSRKWGLTLDTIRALDVVLANGTIVQASKDNYPDLFWALRGASGSFGIVTALHSKTYAAPSSVTTFSYGWNDCSANQTASLLEIFQAYVASSTNMSSNLGPSISLGQGGAKGFTSVEISGAWYGAADAFEENISPLLARLPRADYSSITPGTYIDSIKVLAQGDPVDTNTRPDSKDTFYAKSLMTTRDSPMSSDALLAFAEYLSNEGWATETNWFVLLDLYGGANSAISKVAPDATAFARRDVVLTGQFYTSSATGNPPFPQEGFDFVDGMVNSLVNNSPKGWNYGAYTNYVDDRLFNWQDLYYSSHYGRLEAIKQQYDPQNTFDFPTSIQ